MMLLVILPVAAWEVRGMCLGASYLRLTFQNEMWVDEQGYIAPTGLLLRILRNLDDHWAIGSILTNSPLSGFALRPVYFLDALARGSSIALFLLGLVQSIRRRMSATDIYTLIYLGGISLCVTGIDRRSFVPLVPLLFHYALTGAQAVARLARQHSGALAAKVACAGFLVYSLLFLRVGVAELVWSIRDAHTSPFGSYPIKHRHN